MRKLLATAVAIAPLMVASGAMAEVVVSNARTTPIQTSNAAGSTADNIRLASGGSISVTTGAAITVDSANSIDLDSGSSINMTNAADNAVAILVSGAATGVTIGGGVAITDSVDTYTDTDKDGDLDGKFATGTGRYGLRATGPGAINGNVTVEATGSINVQGDNSYGVSLEKAVTGDVTVLGAVAVTGDNSIAIQTTAPVSGDVVLSGSGVTALGANSVAVAVDGGVGGRLQIQSSATATGYRYTQRLNPLPTGATLSDQTLYLEDLDADDLLQGGPAVRIAADVAGGVLLDVAPAYRFGVDGDDDRDGVKNGDEDDDGDGTKNSTDTDRDGDGIPDVSEGAASVTSYGSAPAIRIGSTTSAVTLGAVGTGAEAFGFINRGSINGSGVFDNLDARAVQFGVAGGQAVTIAGGVNNAGEISAAAFSGSATALTLNSGATTPRLVNSGNIGATANTEDADTTTGVLVAAGAALPTIVNSGNITAGVFGERGSAYAIRDLSGTVTSVTNNGLIAGVVTATDDARDTDDSNVDAGDEILTGRAIAADFSANTSGVTFVQFGDSSATDVDSDGDGTFDPTDTDDDGDGVLDAADTDDSDDDNDGVYDADEPIVSGQVLFGSGADTFDIRNGQVVGDIAFGAGADRLAVSGGATVRGALSDSDGRLSIDVSNGVLDARQTTTLNVSDLTVGANGDLIVTVDPLANTSGGFNVAGTATLASGSGLGVRFSSLIDGSERFTVIRAGTLNFGAIDPASVQANSPYLYVVGASANVAAGEVYIDARRRTAEELEFIPVEAQAYDAIYAGLGTSTALRDAFLSQTNREGLLNVYEQLLPDHSGGPLLSLASGVDAVTRALTGRNASAQPGETSAWLQEINFYADKDKTDSYGFRSEGFGVAGGVERGTGLGAFGVSLAFTSSDLEDPEAEAEEVLSANLVELGLYWRAQGQYWTTWARAAGGYATFDATRAFVGSGLNLRNESTWNGFSLALAGGASYERNFGRLNVRPEIYGEYFSLSEEDRAEEGAGDGFDLEIDSRDGHILSTVAAVNIGYGFGTNGWIRPEVRLGWRQNISVDAGETIARFVSGGPDFTLDAKSIEGGGPIAGFRLSVGNTLGMLSINADAEMIEDYVRYTLLLRASFRF